MVAPSWAATLSVVYPKVGKPYNQIFDTIIDGIENEFDGELELVRVPRKFKVANVITEIQKQKPDMVITLSGRGFKVARSLKGQVPVVSVSKSIRPDSFSGISEAADPRVMFNYLKQLAPGVEQIHVVYSPYNQWLIDLAKVTAAELGMKLMAYPVKGTPAAVKQYEVLIKSAKKVRDAFWVPMDRKTGNKLSLNLLLDAQWERHLVVFSSRPTHAQRGVLFSLVPNYEELGVELVKMVKSIVKGTGQSVFRPIKEVKLAVNIRTASHLGLEYTAQEKGRFDIIFPTK